MQPLRPRSLRRLVFPLSAALLATLLSPALLASDTPSSTAIDPNHPEIKKQLKNPNRRVCKRVKVTGSHFRQKVCRSQAEWARIREASQNMMKDITSGPSTSAPQG